MGMGITPEQVAQMVALWRRCGQQLGDLEVGADAVDARGSQAIASLNACVRTTRTSIGEHADHWAGLAQTLDRFRVLTEEADAVAAAALAQRRQS